MSALSNFAENKLIDMFFRGQAAPTTTTLYVALFLSAPVDATPGVEPTGNDYARVGVASSLNSWAGTQGVGSTTASSGTGGVTSNNVSITFATPSPVGWGLVTHFGLFDAATNGNMLIHGALSQTKTINAGDSVVFPAGSLQITFA